jgi:soluble lytic murein transglycosylase
MPSLTIALTRLMLAACLAAVPALGLAGRGLSQDAAFLAARDAFRAGDAARIARHAATLDQYLLKPWADYWLLKVRLEDAQPEALQGFLDRNAGTYLAEALRRDWIRVLGKKEQWDLFDQELPKLVADDPEIACYALLARWRAGVLPDHASLKPYWYAPRELPEGCAPLAEEAFQSGLFGEAQVWERFRLLSEANLIGAAKRTLAWLPPKQAPSAQQVDAAASSPSRALDRLHDLRTRSARELAILALSRLARADPQLAAIHWEKILGSFAAGDRGYVWGQIATEGAKHHLPQSLDWFAEAGDAALTDEQLAWRTRIALRQQRWADVSDATERLSPAARGESTWVYWHARALRELGQAGQASAEFARIAGQPNFYGQLAAEELGRRVQVPPRAAAATQEELAEVSANVGLKRALALYRLDMRVEGMREWNWAIRGMGDRMLLAAAELARRNEVWDRTINTADRTVALHDYALRYPTPYGDVLLAQARERELEEHWVLGLVRQESRFVAGARSSAGASGLMQLMPATARWMAHKLGLRGYSWTRVTDVETNAALGTAYLKQVLTDLDGSLVLAAAGYNAGPGRARRWRDAHPIEGAIYAESIPFNETRDYVKKVMANTVLYSAVLGGAARPLKEQLGTIMPSASAERFAAITVR